jgi:hypothetical protein
MNRINARRASEVSNKDDSREKVDNTSQDKSFEISFESKPAIQESNSFTTEGNTQPLLPDRASQFALECWNLRKSVLDQNSQILKLKNDLKTQKNLVKNLQNVLNTGQNENLMKSREVNQFKAKVAEDEKKFEDLLQQSTLSANSLTKQRRITQSLQQKITETEKIYQTKSTET